MHDDDFEHDHPIGPNAVVEDLEGVEMFSLKSVGIDIGSSTSHLVFSRLTLRRQGASLSGRFRVTEREVIFRSGIMLTPYLSGTLIDTDQVKQFIQESYREAGLGPQEVDTGAVIITGEALKKENAQPIVEFFAQYSGKFICAAAGHNHEALLAAYGCGAVDLSQREKARVLNVDMGGGTTKFSLIEEGIVSQTASINVGARLIAFDAAGTVTRLEEAGRLFMERLGYPVALGQKISRQAQEDLAASMAGILIEMIEQGPTSALAKRLLVTEPFTDYRGLEQIDYLVFSGGVSEHVYDRDRTCYGDVGPFLGEKIRTYLDRHPRKDMLREPLEGIRATVIGAGEYTMQASGHTSYISHPGALPAFGLKVIRAPVQRGRAVRDVLSRSLAKFGFPVFTGGLAFALTLEGQQDYHSIREVAEGIAEVVQQADDDFCPLYLTMDMDVAKSLGAILKEELKLGREIIALDGIDVGDLDYIDIGSAMGNTEVIPVTVKSLMFPATKVK